MKIGFIFVLYKTPQSEIKRLKEEIKKLGFNDYKTYFIDNTLINRGYAAAANIGIKQAMKDGVDLFAIANPDVSLVNLRGSQVAQTAKQFDVFGFAMKQEGKVYYGGKIDKWRMSGGLIDKKPKNRFSEVDFVSGSLMFIKKEVIEKIGFMDESYFLYYEEVDYCKRAKLSGFKIGIDSQQIYDHFEVSKYSSSKNYYLFKNRLKFLLKYGNIKQKIRELLRAPKTIYEEVVKRPFYLNFFSLNITSLINKILHFFFFLLLIRSFVPQDYAIYTLAWTQVGLLLPILDFGTTSYGLVYLPGQKPEGSSSLFSFRFVLSLVTFVLTIALAFAFRYPVKVLVPILLTSIVIFANTFSGSYLIFASVVEKSYITSIVSMIFQIILILSLIIGVILTHSMTVVFIIIFILYGLYALVSLFLTKKQVKTLKFKLDFPAWVKIGKRSIIFLIISLLAGLYSKADVLLLNFLKGEAAVGVYSAGYRFLDASMFIVTAYNISSMPLFSKLAKKSKALFITKIKKDVILVFTIGFGLALCFYLFSPIVLPVLMKGDYASSISVLRIIIFALPLILLTSVALNCLYSLNKAKSVIYLFGFQVFYNVIANYLFIPRYGFFASSWITVIGESVNTILSFIILRKAINENFN